MAVAAHDVGAVVAPVGGGLEEAKGQRIYARDGQGAAFVCLVRHWVDILKQTEEIGLLYHDCRGWFGQVLQQARIRQAVIAMGELRDFDALLANDVAGCGHVERIHRAGQENAPTAARPPPAARPPARGAPLARANRHQDGFGESRAAVVHRRVADVHAG